MFTVSRLRLLRTGKAPAPRRALSIGVGLIAAVGLTGCIGAVDRDEIYAEAAQRGGGVDGDRALQARDAIAKELGVDAADVQLNAMTLQAQHISVNAASVHKPRIWDSYLYDGKSARAWTERKTDSIDGWFVLEDIPALHRLDELVPTALAERGITPGTVGVKARINCDHFGDDDWQDDHEWPAEDSAQREIPQCPVTIRIHFDHDREDYEGVTFDAEGGLRR